MTGSVWCISPKRDCLLLHLINSQRLPHKVMWKSLGYFLLTPLRDKTNFSDTCFRLGFSSVCLSFFFLPFFNERKAKCAILMIHHIILYFWDNQNFFSQLKKIFLPIHCFHLKSLKTLGVLSVTLEKHEMIVLFSWSCYAGPRFVLNCLKFSAGMFMRFYSTSYPTVASKFQHHIGTQ